MGGLNSGYLSRDVLQALGFARLGEDVLIHSTAVIVDCSRIALGSRVRIDPFVIISNTGGVEFGNDVHIGGHSALSGHGAIRIEDFVNISHNVGIFTTSFAGDSPAPGFPPARTSSLHFGRHAGVGAGSIVLPGARFAEGSGLGALSLTGRPLEPWTMYAGVPARRLGERRRDSSSD